ncbi:MAG: M20/M25/M40 family metallo-hydrolase [Candidatus Ozemobacteraceae bacterium]
MMRTCWNCLRLLAPIAFFFVLFSWVWWLDQPPDALSSNAPVTEFSAERAMEYVRLLGQRPHRAGTAANDDVRATLLQILRSQRLTVVTDEPTVARGWTVANPRNIFARLSGNGPFGAPTSHRAFLLMAHYDSVPYGPGSADDLAGIAAILETLRAIKAGRGLANDLIIAFTDGEECGLLGAKGFAMHPWAKDVGCMLNFEARGVCGPSYLFEFGEPKAWLIPEVARSKAPVRTSSLMFEVFRRLPFTTDYHMLRDFIPGMNIAFLGRFPYYHSASDNPGNLDLRSLQHHGAYALAFAQHFGNIPLNADYSKPQLTFFSLFGSHLFWYSKKWNGIFTILISAMFGLVLLREHIHGELKKRPVIRGIFAYGLLLFVGGLVAAFVLGVGWLWRGPFLLYQNTCFIFSGSLLSTAATILVYGTIRRRLPLRHLTRGALFFWSGGMVLQTMYMSEGVFLWQWPLFAALLGTLVSDGCALLTGGRSLSPIILLFVSIPVFAFGVPILSGLSEALAVFILPILVVCAGLGAGLLLPLIDRSISTLKRPLCGILAVAGIIFFSGGVIFSSPSVKSPRMSHLLYHKNADTNEANWCSVDGEPGPWTPLFFTSTPELRPLPEIFEGLLWQSPAPPGSISAPVAEVVEQFVGTDSTRVLRIKLFSPRGGNRLRIHAMSKASTLSAKMNGIPLEIGGPEWSLDYSILPKKPVELVLVLTSNDLLTLILTDISYSLPVGVPPRPDDYIPMNNVLNRGSHCESDTTQVTKKYSL